MQSAQSSPDRLRNIALLVAYLNNKKHKVDRPSLVREFIASQPKELEEVPARYNRYIRESIKEWK